MHAQAEARLQNLERERASLAAGVDELARRAADGGRQALEQQEKLTRAYRAAEKAGRALRASVKLPVGGEPSPLVRGKMQYALPPLQHGHGSTWQPAQTQQRLTSCMLAWQGLATTCEECTARGVGRAAGLLKQCQRAGDCSGPH